jgi:TonB family protein
VQPAYPEAAIQAHVQGDVRLELSFDTEGNVEKVSVISGDPLLAPAAVEAAKKWKFYPYLLGGVPAGAQTMISISFNLAKP